MEKALLLSMLLFCIYANNLYVYGEHTIGYQVEMKEEARDKAEKAFRTLIVDDETKNEFIPSQTKILSVQWDGKILVVDVSKEIGDYGGGTAIEHEIMCQLLNTAFSIQEVEVFTLLIEGEEKYLPEGTEILNYTRERYLENVARY